MSKYIVVEGQTIILHCPTVSINEHVAWYHSSTENSRGEIIYTVNVGPLKGRANRFSVKTDGSGQFDLIITKIQSNDSGTYTCIENDGLGSVIYTYQLHVSGKR